MAFGRIGDEGSAPAASVGMKDGFFRVEGVPSILLLKQRLESPWSAQVRPGSVLIVRHTDGRTVWKGHLRDIEFARLLVERLNGYEAAREFPPPRSGV